VSRVGWIARQSRLPEGLLGEVVALAMSYDTARVNRSVADHLDVQPADEILELGFGSGRALLEVAARARFVAGVDPSEVMLRHARFRNGRYLRSGRVAIGLGEAAHIPYPDARFDKAYAIHVLYFWAEPQQELREIRRVLRPGGRLLLGFRPKDDPAVVAAAHPAVYTLRTLLEVEKLLDESGFGALRTTVVTDRGRQMGWALARS
jgi:ubiquinone/menaquinone biosynthesis C-methylase UbiE